MKQMFMPIKYSNHLDRTIFPIHKILAFIPVHDVTLVGLTCTLIETLKTLGLNLEKMRGRGYDGAMIMSGAFSGVQVIVRKKYPEVLYSLHISFFESLFA